MFRVKRTCENVWRRSFYVQIDYVSGYRGKTLEKHRTKPDKTKSEFEKTLIGLVQRWPASGLNQDESQQSISRHFENCEGFGGRFTDLHDTLT